MEKTTFPDDEIVIEIDGPFNRERVFYPANTNVRSRWFPQRVCSDNMPGVFIELMAKGIPGQRIHLDAKRKVGRITDAIGDPENEEIRKRCKYIALKLKERGKLGFGVPTTDGEPVKEVEHGIFNDEEYHTWMYWMRRLVDGFTNEGSDADSKIQVPVATLIQGKLPSLVDILKTKKVRRHSYQRHPGMKSHVLLPEEEARRKGVPIAS